MVNKLLLLVIFMTFIVQQGYASFSEVIEQDYHLIHRTFTYENVNEREFEEQFNDNPLTNSVTLDECEIHSEILQSLHRVFPELLQLTLSDVNLQDNHLTPLHPNNDPNKQNFSGLKSLDISCNPSLSSEGIACLAGRSFVSLDLSYNTGLDDQVFDSLLSTLLSLETLNLKGTSLTLQRIEAFKNTNPHITVLP